MITHIAAEPEPEILPGAAVQQIRCAGMAVAEDAKIIHGGGWRWRGIGVGFIRHPITRHPPRSDSLRLRPAVTELEMVRCASPWKSQRKLLSTDIVAFALVDADVIWSEASGPGRS